MSSIGAFSFIRMTGPQVPKLAVAMMPIDRAGVDGYAFREDAKKVPDIALQTVEGMALLATANSAADDYAALIGTEVTIVDDMARTVNNVMVLAVQVNRVQEIFTPSPASMGNYLVHASWLVKPTTT